MLANPCASPLLCALSGEWRVARRDPHVKIGVPLHCQRYSTRFVVLPVDKYNNTVISIWLGGPARKPDEVLLYVIYWYYLYLYKYHVISWTKFFWAERTFFELKELFLSWKNFFWAGKTFFELEKLFSCWKKFVLRFSTQKPTEKSMFYFQKMQAGIWAGIFELKALCWNLSWNWAELENAIFDFQIQPRFVSN